jgi:hypothetical protein
MMEHYEQLENLLTRLHNKTRIEKHETDEMFALHNLIHPTQPEYGKTCSTCRNRVYKKLISTLDHMRLTNKLKS